MSQNISLKDFINYKYSQYLASITTLSCTGKKDFIVDDRKFYNFDKMICEFYSEDCKPTSADALYILDDNTILFVEFKTGYKNDISIYDIDNNKFGDNNYCPNCHYKNILPACHEAYWYSHACKQLAQREKKKNIFLKIVESYIIFKEKFITDYIDSYMNNKNKYLCHKNNCFFKIISYDYIYIQKNYSKTL